jgi:hypothetical protein
MARAGSFGNIRKPPSGRYQARYWHLGKQVAAETTFTSKTDAHRLARHGRGRHAPGHLGRSRRRPHPVRRVRDPVDR